MAKKVTRESIETATYLKISISDFQNDLTERIKIGNDLISKHIKTNDDFEKLEYDYSSWSDYNSEYLKQKFTNPNSEYKKSYDQAGNSYFVIISRNGGDDPLGELRSRIKSKISNLSKLVEKAALFPTFIDETPGALNKNSKDGIDRNSVFIVHGHDDLAKSQTARFLQKIGLNPIILHEQPSSGKTIIEKIEEHSNVGFGLVLYTACDIGANKNQKDNLKNRARQNVVFEHGYLMGKIGRNNVCALLKGEIEIPNDISGIVYVNMDEEDAWNLKIARELKRAGYAINLEALLY